jgi:hypothetical protein
MISYEDEGLATTILSEPTQSDFEGPIELFCSLSVCIHQVCDLVSSRTHHVHDICQVAFLLASFFHPFGKDEI